MSHYVESIAYVGQRPWHGIGNELEKGATPDQMMKSANLDWSVSKRPLMYGSFVDGQPEFELAEGNPTGLDRHFALVRDSDNKPLSVVGRNYIPVQNKDVFDFFAKFCEAGHMTMETAGSLKNGRFVWALAKFSDGFTLGRGRGADPVTGHLLLCSPYDPGKSLVIQTTPIRVVCWNTLSMALGQNLQGQSEHIVRLPHIYDFGDRNIQLLAEEALGLAQNQMTEFHQAAELLMASPAAMDNVMQYWVDVLKLAKAVEVAEENGKEPVILTVLKKAYTDGPGANLKTAKDTWWGAFNALTYVVDHHRGRDADAFLHSAWFGRGAMRKRQGIREAVAWASK